MGEHGNDLKMGVITLDQQENSPYLPYIQLNLNAINQFLDMIKNNPDIKPESLRPFVTTLTKLIPIKKLAKQVEDSLPRLNAIRMLEQKLLQEGVSLEDYNNNPEIKKRIDSIELNDTKRSLALRYAEIDQFGLYITEYIGPKFDTDGHKMGIVVATVRNDKDMLLPTKHLTEEERKRLNIRTYEDAMQEEFYPGEDLDMDKVLSAFKASGK